MDDPDLTLRARIVDFIYNTLFDFKILIFFIIGLAVLLVALYFLNGYINSICPPGSGGCGIYGYRFNQILFRLN